MKLLSVMGLMGSIYIRADEVVIICPSERQSKDPATDIYLIGKDVVVYSTEKPHVLATRLEEILERHDEHER